MGSWDPRSGRSPLGLPLPETVGRQHMPEMSEIAAEQRVTRDRGGEEVEHLCPNCSGTESGLIIIQTCGMCGGRGRLTDDRFTRIFGSGGRAVVV